MKNKSIKDAIHGYIQIEEPFWRIVDTAEFQRLKWVEQTSYRVLFPSARHDRFIHSIGVYHLGQKAVRGFLKNSKEDDMLIINEYKNSFLLGCLLHDIGHAPFSHTCEDLFNYQDKVSNVGSQLNQELLSEMKLKLNPEEYTIFESDYKYILTSGKAPSEHEIVSAIIVCRKSEEFCGYFFEAGGDNIDLDLAVRSILGCCYATKRSDGGEVNRVKGIKNCLIRLLNSSTVDVDKLDYIARDTQMSGYDNIVLDTERLLDSICIISNENVCYPSFKKNALSVINNVVIAKNSQAKWIVNHPIVLYDAYILRRAIGESLKALEIQKDGNLLSNDDIIKFIFSSRSLSKEGNHYTGGSFALLSDVEILHLMKQNISNTDVSEYFARNERKGPVWKSHEEFLFCLDSDGEKAEEVATFLAPLANYLNSIEDLCHGRKIDSSLYEQLMQEESLEGKEVVTEILEVLKKYKREDGTTVELDYVMLPAKNKFFTRMDSKQLYIRFDDTERGYTTYNTFENESVEVPKKAYEFYFLYSKEKIDAKHFLKYLSSEAHECGEIRM